MVRLGPGHRVHAGPAPASPLLAPVVQRCGPVPCNCTDDERATKMAGHGGLLSLQRLAGNAAVSSALREGRTAGITDRGVGASVATAQRQAGNAAVNALLDRAPTEVTVSRQSAGSTPTPSACRYTAAELAHSRSSDGAAWPRDPNDDELLIYDFLRGSSAIRGAHSVFLRDLISDLRLDTTTPTRRVKRIIGFTDCVDRESVNGPLRRARASAVRQFLLDNGALPSNVGQSGDDTSAAHPGNDTPGQQRDLMRSVRLELETSTPPPDQTAEPTPAPDQTGGDEGTQQRICGPDVTSALVSMLSTVEPWFVGLTGFQQSRSCMALGPGGFLVGVNPGMAWDTRQLFLPNTDWLDAYFLSRSCGSPRDPGCETDPERHLCETAGTCGNSVVVNGKCMLAGTANYALFGKMCRLCHDYTGRWNRWDMRAIIGVWKTIGWDDSAPPKEVASAAYDGAFPSVPGGAENRGSCTGRCGATHGGAFDFIWEPYMPR